jgi:hypothetical protein
MKAILLCLLVLLAQAGVGRSDEQPARADVPAPELFGPHWLNTPDGKPITLASRQGYGRRVLDFRLHQLPP